MKYASTGRPLHLRKAAIYAGTVLAFLIGAAFATGQEVLIYYVSWGSQLFTVIIVVFALVIWITLSLAIAGALIPFQSNEEIFTFFCGKTLGKFYHWFAAIFCFACYILMINGAGSSLHQQFGIPCAVGTILLSAITVPTVYLGLNRITDILGRLGNAIIIAVLIIAVWNLVKYGASVPANLQQLDVQGPAHFGIEVSIAPNAVINGMNCVGTIMLWFVTFITMLAAKSETKRDAVLGLTAGGFIYIICVLIAALAMVATIEQIGGSDAPNIILAGNLFPWLSTAYAVIVVAGCYTTAVPLLWTPVSQLSESGSRKSRVIILLLGVLGVLIALFVPYKKLVNYIINIGGMLAYLLYFLIARADVRLYRLYRLRKKEKLSSQEKEI